MVRAQRDFPEFEAQLRAQYGLDQPMYVQYFKWMRNILLRGEFGYSFIYKRDASDLIVERLPLTLALSLSTFLFVWIVSLPIGIFSAVRKYSIGDYIATFLGFIGLATPGFCWP
ncbi:MAG: ABC transporter permease [Caldilineaceae bacterium]